VSERKERARKKYALPNEDFSQSAIRLSILELFSVGKLCQTIEQSITTTDEGMYLKIHVAVRAHEKALIFESPFKSDKYRFTRKFLHERLWVDGVDLARKLGLHEREHDAKK